MSNFVSKNVRTPQLKVVASATLAASLALGGTVLAAAVTAPAAQAAAAFCCSGGLSASPSDPGLVTVTFTNKGGEVAPGTVDLTNPTGSVSVPVAPATVVGHYDAQNNWVPPVASVTTATFRLLPGQTAQARIGTIVLGNPYTNPATQEPAVVAPTRVGNVITIPGNQGGTVQYIPVGGAARPLPAGYQFTLASGDTVTIGEFKTDTARTLLGSWTFSYVAPPPAQVTPAAPRLISGNLYEIPTGSGYHYEVAGKVVTGTVYATKEGTVVMAVSDSASLELVGPTVWPLEYATPPVPDEDNTKKIMICHATGSETNPYEAKMVPVNGLEGHEHHPGDIWPASDGVEAHNWTEANAKIYAANCEVKAPTPPPSNGGDNGDHGGTTPPPVGGTTTPPPASGNTNTGTTTPTVPVTTPTQTPVTGTQPAGTGLVVKASTGVGSSTDPASIMMLGGAGAAAIGISLRLLFRRPKHRA